MGKMTVVEVYEGYPAHEAGIRPGDVVRERGGPLRGCRHGHG